MADHKTLPVFAYAEELPQLADIRAYLNGLGATLDPKGPENIVDNLVEVSGSLGFLGQRTPSDIDAVLNSVCSLIVTIGADEVPIVVETFCKSLNPEHFKGNGWGTNGGNVVRVLSNLFHGFATLPRTQKVVYQQLIEMAREARLIGEIDCRVETLEEHFKLWNSTVEEKRVILRQIHAALLHDSRADQAAKVMLMLLGTYTDDDAFNAREDATECVRTAVVDPKSFSFDQLQRLSAVRALQKSDPLMHTALEIFINGTLKDYKDFVGKHPDFISQKLRVDESILLKKIRLLTLMTIAESNNVIALEELSNKLELPNDEELEEFIIEALQVNAITGKMNEITRELHVTSYQHRKFGKEQWISLQKRLETLISNLETTQGNIENINTIMDDQLAGIVA